MRSTTLSLWLFVFALASFASLATESESPYWAVDPNNPGPNLPVAGRSLFDVLFERDDGYQVPFPFSALLANIEGHLEPGKTPIRVLIPLGRSLQREAAAPLYFTYPRVVVAIDAEPRHEPGTANVFLRSLLFLGYQEKAKTIEVISYNDEAGRFEFQTVRNYGQGLVPRVTYAERGLCTACHQNGGPIFSETPWSETDDSYNISLRIEALHPEYYDKPYFMRTDKRAWSIDYATDRANYFAAYQLLWRRACGVEPAVSEASVKCRAAVLEAIIKFRLNGAWYVHSSARRFQTRLLTSSPLAGTSCGRGESMFQLPIFPTVIRLPRPD